MIWTCLSCSWVNRPAASIMGRCANCKTHQDAPPRNVAQIVEPIRDYECHSVSREVYRNQPVVQTKADGTSWG